MPGSHLQLALPSIFDVYRALYPVIHSSDLSQSVNAAARFSNSCIFLSEGTGKVAATVDDAQARERLEESKDRMKVLGASTLDDIVVRFFAFPGDCRGSQDFFLAGLGATT